MALLDNDIGEKEVAMTTTPMMITMIIGTTMIVMTTVITPVLGGNDENLL